MSDCDGDDDDQISEVPPFVTCRPPRLFTFFSQRYFTHYLVANAKGVPGNNVRLLLHSNGVVLICMDPSHVVVTENLNVLKVHHSVTRNGKVRDRQQGAANVQGKRKKNAMWCQAEMVLVVVETEHFEFRLPSCIAGCVIEMNPFLQRDPTLIARAPLTEGFIAIINPKGTPDYSKYELISRAVDPGDVDAMD